MRPRWRMGWDKLVALATIAGLYTLAWLFGPALLRSWSDAAAARDWPAVEGRVLSSGVEDRSGEWGKVYRSSIRYAYAVEGRELEGKRRLLDEPWRGEAGAREIAARYAVGAKVLVRHDPDHPEASVLEVGFGVPALETTIDVPYAIGLAFLLWLAARRLVSPTGAWLRERDAPPGTRRLELHRRSPETHALIGALAPTVPVALVAWFVQPETLCVVGLPVVLVVGALVGLGMARAASDVNERGALDVVIEGGARRMRFPHWTAGGGSEKVVRADLDTVEGAAVREAVETDGDGNSTTRYEPVIRMRGPGTGPEVPLTRLASQEDAEWVAAWVNEALTASRRGTP